MMFPETRAAWRGLVFNLRALISEWLMTKAMDVCPMGYSPAIIDMVIEACLTQAAEGDGK